MPRGDPRSSPNRAGGAYGQPITIGADVFARLSGAGIRQPAVNVYEVPGFGAGKCDPQAYGPLSPLDPIVIALVWLSRLPPPVLYKMQTAVGSDFTSQVPFLPSAEAWTVRVSVADMGGGGAVAEAEEEGLGVAVGEAVGAGVAVCVAVGAAVGGAVGAGVAVGAAVGGAIGAGVGATVGATVGAAVFGVAVGFAVALRVAVAVAVAVGAVVAVAVASIDGEATVASVGDAVNDGLEEAAAIRSVCAYEGVPLAPGCRSIGTSTPWNTRRDPRVR